MHKKRTHTQHNTHVWAVDWLALMAPQYLTRKEVGVRSLCVGLFVLFGSVLIFGHMSQTRVNWENDCGYYDKDKDTINLFQSIIADCVDCIQPPDRYASSRVRSEASYVTIPSVGRLRGLCSDGLLLVTEQMPGIDALDSTKKLRYSALISKQTGSDGSQFKFTGRVAICIQALAGFPEAHSCNNEL